jgi:hypothetical protein
LVVPAFKELGQKNVTTEMIERVKRLLKNEKPEILKEDARLAPSWIASIFYDTLKKTSSENAVAD